MSENGYPEGLMRIVQKFSPEKLDEFAHLSAKDKLRWLEEINLFLWKITSERKRRVS